MIASLLLPDLAVDAGGDEPGCEGGAEQQVIDAQARVAGVGIAEVIPERVDPLPR